MITHTTLKRLLLFCGLCSFGLNGIFSKPTHSATEFQISETTEIDEIAKNIATGQEEEQNKIPNGESEYRAKYANKMLTYMNLSVDPCDDFYEYACGNWKNIIKERQATHKRSNLLDIIYHLMDTVEVLLQKSPETLELDYASELKIAQQFYKNCLTAEFYPMQKSLDYLEAIKSIGGFPAVDISWKADNFSWFNMSAHLTNYGAAGLIREDIIPQYPFPPYFKLPELGFDYIVQSDNIATNTSRGYELNEKRMREYLTTYGVAEVRISQIISEIFDFWRAALKLSDQFFVDNNNSTVEDEFEQWNDYFAIAWLGKDFDYPEAKCPCDHYYHELDAICSERKEAVANYLAMKFLYHMDSRLKDATFQKEYCIMKLQSTLPYLIDTLYFKDYFNSEVRSEITTIVQEIRKSLRIILQEADWLDDATRKEALLKESTLVSRIGSFEDPEMTERLIREMNNIIFLEGNYAQNNMNLEKFKMFMKRYNGLHYEELRNDTKPLDLLVGMQVNSFYYNVDNSINVMAGILHPPAYHKAWPNSLKFGTIGYLIGHELTHGFDSVGANYDSIGDERYWWTSKSGNVFTERANCYIDHYSSYLIPQINQNVNGNLTMDENIADSGGLVEALNAYRRYMKELSRGTELSTLMKDEQMPGLDLSPEQLFFLGFSQVWCASYEEEHFWEELSTEHTIDKYRVLGAVTNSADFSKAYNCPLGSKMNPEVEKCRMW